jgi:hypothetical protein
VVEHLSNKFEALSSNPIVPQTEKAKWDDTKNGGISQSAGPILSKTTTPSENDKAMTT